VWLARRLKPFRISSKSIRIDSGNAKGYESTDFQEAFERYLPNPEVSSRHTVTSLVDQGQYEILKRHNEKPCDGSKTHEEPVNIDWCHRDALKANACTILADRTIDELLEAGYQHSVIAEMDRFQVAEVLRRK
jgi:hypothetical protein